MEYSIIYLMSDSFNLQPSSCLTKSEKLGFAGLIILAIVILYLGFSQMGNNIKGPFLARLAASLSKNNAEDVKELNAEEQMAILKTKDTDKDGLSDYDELNIYQTSPYIADTDSDGISDKMEIEKNTDPNCPTGKNCKSELANPTAGASTTTTLSLPFSSMPTADQLLLQSVFGNNPDPKTIRDFLSKQGVDQKTLDAFSDAELLQTFKEITSATTVPLTTAPAPPTQVDYNNLSAGQLRDLLAQQGVSTEALKKISDKDLLEMVKEIK
ncbi:MAG: putative calcium-binding protein [Candidatus Magasanikbacteria bacterium GW2011_GWC2_41_17]|uniref:Putative calcium-binding protein n=1 Tax=Candidatus Magasanikbacteria bacterium GW2011_GWC2_41_17 TaxID=1619048 RepID=A0A0G0YEV1_9BACT|nr:MAG: putative calcium-binding protein [Candidatus Magasanikbacteria bacterium GW2011_GWC2_41_17]